MPVGRPEAFVDALKNGLLDCKLLKVAVVNCELVLFPKPLKTVDVTDTVEVATVVIVLLALEKKDGKPVDFAPALVTFEKALKLVVVVAGELLGKIFEPPVNVDAFKLPNADAVVFGKLRFEVAFDPKPLNKNELFAADWEAVVVGLPKDPNAGVVVGATPDKLCPKKDAVVDVAVFVEAGKIELFVDNPLKVELFELKLNI